MAGQIAGGVPGDGLPEGGTPTLEGTGSTAGPEGLLAQKLVKLRRRKDLSQQQVADLLGVSRQTISNWECGQGAPALDKALELARVYGVSLDDLARDSVGVSTSCRGERGRDLHVLAMVRGCVCRIDCDNDDWVLSGAGTTDVRVLDVDADWMRVEYERRNAATLKKERVVQLVDVADVTCISIVEGPADAVEGEGR